MTVQEQLQDVLSKLPEQRLQAVYDFATFLLWQEQQAHKDFKEWMQFGKHNLARAYGPNEPEYSRANVIRDLR